MGIPGPPERSWGRARRAVGAALAIAWLGWAVLAPAQQAATREVELEIIAGWDWAAAGIDVQPGDTVAIEAGEAPSSQGPMSPDGVRDAATDNIVDPKLPYAALIGRIGEGPAFLVGARYEEKMTAAGPLRLRWNLLRSPSYSPTHEVPPEVFMVKARHTPAPPPDPDDGDPAPIGNESATEIVSAGEAPVEAVEPRSSPRRPEPPVERRPAPRSLLSTAGPWLLGLAFLLLAAAAGLALQRRARARTVKRTRAMLSLSPSLDLAEGRCPEDDLPAEGPAASLRTRLEPGHAHMEEGSGDG